MKKNCLIVLSSTLLIFFFLIANPTVGKFEKQKKLQWQNNNSCYETNNDYSQLKHSSEDKRRAVCRSSWFNIKAGTSIQIYYWGDFKNSPNSDIRIYLKRKKGDAVAGKRIYPDEGNEQIRRMTYDATEDQTLRVEFKVFGDKINSAHISSYVDILSFSKLHNKIYQFFSGNKISLFLLLSSLSFFLYFIIQNNSKTSNTNYVIILVIAFFTQYRFPLFFHADEWVYLKQLTEGGIFLPHNEHFIPVFSIFYKVQKFLFGSYYQAYVFCSLLLLFLNSILLIRFIQDISPIKIPGEVSSLVSIFYVINFNHTETVQWVLSQSSILTVTFSLLAMIELTKFYKDKKTKNLILLNLFFVFAALSFGIGFLLPILLFFQYLFMILTDPSNTFNTSILQVLKKSSIFRFSICLLVTTSLLLIVREQKPEGFYFKDINTNLEFTFLNYIHYIMSGTFFGTFLRGTGLFPLPAIQELYYLAQEQSLDGYFRIRMYISSIGLFLCLLIAFIYWKIENSKIRIWAICSWFYGLIWITLPMVIISMGRVVFGDDNALTSRYQAYPMIGLFVLLSPLFVIVQNKLHIGNLKAKIFIRVSSTMLIASMLHSHINLHHFINAGREFYIYKDKYCYWKANNHSGLYPSLYSHYDHMLVKSPYTEHSVGVKIECEDNK